MNARVTGRIHRWHATLIVALFAVAVGGAAAIGWWYARESPPHHGPIVLISVDGMPAADLPVYGGQRTDTPAIDTLASEAVVFDRAYTHSPETLPAHASLLSGQLPFEHGVRGDAGFALKADARTLAELLRNRGFDTGAAVSSFLLRPESGVAQGFAFFDAELPASSDFTPSITRVGSMTVDTAERWVAKQDSQRFFLFLQVAADDADAAVTRIRRLLDDRGVYDDATIVLVGDRGDAGPVVTLDETSLRVPLLVKQPGSEGAGRRIDAPVQHIDLVPTILDLVRAPVPGNLRGRSLRSVLSDEDGTSLDEAMVYAETFAARLQFGGDPLFSLANSNYRLVRGDTEELTPLFAPTDVVSGESAQAGRLRTTLDRLLDSDQADAASAAITIADQDRFALFGYLPSPTLRLAQSALDWKSQQSIADAHRAAAVLIGQKKYAGGIRTLQAILRDHPDLAVIHYQLGGVFLRTGRLDEAISAYQTARELHPDEPELTRVLADALARAGQLDAAWKEAEAAIALAGKDDKRQQAASHELAARIALARNDAEAALSHAASADEAAPEVPVSEFVRGRLEYEDGNYQEAAAAFKRAIDATRKSGATLSELHFYYGESLAHQARYTQAEAEYREELRAFPVNIQAYTSLAMLYRASNRDDAVEDILNELVASTPTPEGYAVAAQLWTMHGDRKRAEALRSDAQARFRGDPSLALLERGARR
jgi:tetratricopeptide (TPR) repeat protein